MITQKAAARAVELTMRQAQADAAAGLQQHRGTALAAAREKVDRLISTARPSVQSRHARYDPAARLLREWYLDVHAAALDQGLGGPARTPGVAAVEATTARVGRIRTGADPQGPLRATAFVWRVAQTDAAGAVVAAVADLRGTVSERATLYVAGQAGVDADRSAILRHWYQRCYLAAVDAELGLQQPLRVVTAAEAREVAVSVQLARFRQLVGADGVSLVTAHGTRVTDADRRLAAGDVGVVGVAPAAGPANRILRHQVTHSWRAGSPATRTDWAAAAGAVDANPLSRWEDLPGVLQSRLIGQWLEDHQDRFTPATSDPVSYVPFVGAEVTGRTAEESASAMFGHQVQPATVSRHPAVAALFPQPAAQRNVAQPISPAENRRPPAVPARDVER